MLIASILVYLLINLGIGFWASKKIKNTEDFVLAGRQLSFTLATMVTFATWFGSETMMGAPGEFIKGGILGVIEEPLGAALCLVLVGLFFAKTFYRLNILTFCDFFKIRFGQKAEILSALLIVPSYFSWITAQFVAMGVLMQIILGITLLQGIVLGSILVMLYTLLGGMWSVSITDFIHNILLIIGLIILAIIVFDNAGGISNVINKTQNNFFRPIPIEFSMKNWVNYFFAWITIGLGSIPQQDVFQRVMAAKNEKIASRASITAGFLYITIALLPLFIGLAASQIYPELLEGDQKMIVLNLVLKFTSPIIQVLFFGALISAIMSTSSGAILAPASVIGENLIKPFFPKISDKSLLLWIRISIIFVTLQCIWMASKRQNIYELVGESSAFSLVSLFIPMVAGLKWKRANASGCIASMLAGWLVWFYFYIRPNDYPASMYGLIAGFLGLILGTFLEEFLIKKAKTKVD
jgi:solute:Na+ symporter, SSS family